jgi:hypothetical protein
MRQYSGYITELLSCNIEHIRCFRLLNTFTYDHVIIIIIIIIIILGISFMQGIYTYIPETNVPREHCVATILM